MFLLGVLLFIIIIAIMIILGGGMAHLKSFYDLPSVLFVLFSYLSILIATKSFGDFVYGIKALSMDDKDLSKNKLKNAIDLFDMLFKSSFAIGLLGFVIGMINMFARLDEPDAIGPSTAIALLTLFTAMIIAIVFIYPIKYTLVKKIRSMKFKK